MLDVVQSRTELFQDPIQSRCRRNKVPPAVVALSPFLPRDLDAGGVLELLGRQQPDMALLVVADQ